MTVKRKVHGLFFAKSALPTVWKEFERKSEHEDRESSESVSEDWTVWQDEKVNYCVMCETMRKGLFARKIQQLIQLSVWWCKKGTRKDQGPVSEMSLTIAFDWFEAGWDKEKNHRTTEKKRQEEDEGNSSLHLLVRFLLSVCKVSLCSLPPAASFLWVLCDSRSHVYDL